MFGWKGGSEQQKQFFFAQNDFCLGFYNLNPVWQNHSHSGLLGKSKLCIRSLWEITCVASVSVRFRRKERGTRVKDREKSGASKRAGRGWGRKEGNFLPLPLPTLPHFGSRFISRAVNAESPLPRFCFASKPNGNACYAGYMREGANLLRVSVSSIRVPPNP